MKLAAKSLLSGILLTILVFIIVAVVDVHNNPGSATGIELTTRTPFAWIIYWADYFEIGEKYSMLRLWSLFISNVLAYSILSYIFLRMRGPARG